jgi:leader peptidase (prepilin peptidase)/N-methyltransferase
MQGYVLSALGGLVLGGAVNLLADWLPQFRREPEAEGQESDAPVETGEEEVAGEKPPRSRLVRYVAVEIVMLAAGAYLWHREGLSPMFGVLLFYVALFLLIAVIDIEHLLVLGVVVGPAVVVVVIEVLLGGRIRLRDALAGYAFGELVVTGIYYLARGYLRLINRNREDAITEPPFGGGDVMLAAFCGLVVGFPDIFFLLILMILFGGALAIIFLIIRLIVSRRYKAHMPMPYAPAIALAAITMLLWGEQVSRWMLGGR